MSRLDYADNIAVLVGLEEKKFVIHTSALTARSGFFRAAIEGDFKEAKERAVCLPEVELEAWSTYVHWIYSGQVVTLDQDQIKTDQNGRTRREKLIELYFLADILDDKALRNQIIDEYIAVVAWTHFWSAGNIPHLLQNVPESSKFAQLILHYALRSPQSTIGWLKENYDQLPKSFHYQIASEALKIGSDWKSFTAPDQAPKCTYHEHDETLPPCA